MAHAITKLKISEISDEMFKNYFTLNPNDMYKLLADYLIKNMKDIFINCDDKFNTFKMKEYLRKYYQKDKKRREDYYMEIEKYLIMNKEFSFGISDSKENIMMLYNIIDFTMDIVYYHDECESIYEDAPVYNMIKRIMELMDFENIVKMVVDVANSCGGYP